MTKQTLKEALDGAELVHVTEIGPAPVIQVWHGGNGINVYIQESEFLKEVYYYSISHESVPDRSEVKEAMVEYKNKELTGENK